MTNYFSFWQLIPNLDHAGFKTMLKTFYATAIDYHEHGLQPLGLLRLGTTDTTTTNGSSTSEKMFPNEDDTVIVIRRWGFSVLRHLQDVEILLWNNAPPLTNRMQSRKYSSSFFSSLVLYVLLCVTLLKC